MSMKNTLEEIVSAKKEEVQTLPQSSMVSEAIERMSDRNIGALVILGENGRVSGIFSERDLLNRVAGAGLDPTVTPLSHVMTHNPVCVDASLTVSQAMRKVTEQRIRHLPLVSDGTLRGMISSGDLTAWAVKANEAEIDRLTQQLTSSVTRIKILIALVTVFLVLGVIGVFRG